MWLIMGFWEAKMQVNFLPQAFSLQAWQIVLVNEKENVTNVALASYLPILKCTVRKMINYATNIITMIQFQTISDMLAWSVAEQFS